jgi:hypothetical protein
VLIGEASLCLWLLIKGVDGTIWSRLSGSDDGSGVSSIARRDGEIA